MTATMEAIATGMTACMLSCWAHLKPSFLPVPLPASSDDLVPFAAACTYSAEQEATASALANAASSAGYLSDLIAG